MCAMTYVLATNSIMSVWNPIISGCKLFEPATYLEPNSFSLLHVNNQFYSIRQYIQYNRLNLINSIADYPIQYTWSNNSKTNKNKGKTKLATIWETPWLIKSSPSTKTFETSSLKLTHKHFAFSFMSNQPIWNLRII